MATSGPMRARAFESPKSLLNTYHSITSLDGEIMEEEQLQVISVKITKPFYETIKKFLELDAHVTLSDFVRDAIRDKIKNDAPWLYEEMLKRTKEA